MPALDVYSIAAYMFGLFLVYLCIWILIKPLKLLVKIAINSVFGGVLLFIVNWLGGLAGLSIGVNVITSVAVGILGVPGLIMLFVIKFMLY